jgi:hypothetical protein
MAWSPRGGHAHGGGAARLARVLLRTRCPGNSGMSTVRAEAMRLTRWRQRGLTRAAARRAGVEQRRRGDVTRWRRRSGHGRHQWRGPTVPEEGEKVRCTPLVIHDAWRTRLTEGGGWKVDVGGISVSRCRGGEATGNCVDRLGGGAGR